jgi:MSHA biogenesis protein MshN
MSLINQMLKDLELRGAGSTDATQSTSSALSPSMSQSSSFPFIKIGLLVAILAGGIYSWLQTTPKSTVNAGVTNTIPSISVNEKNQQVITKAPTIDTTPVTQPASAAPVPASANPLKINAPTPPVSLFETELKYTPSNYQAPHPKHEQTKQEENVTKPSDEVVAAKATNVKQSGTSLNQVNEAEKSPAQKHSLPRISTKLSSDHLSTGKEINPDQKSRNYYSQAISNLKQGRVSEAQTNLAQALEANPANQEARQTLAGLLLDNKRNDEAKATLVAGLAITPEQPDFRIALARIQVESGDRAAALSTLEQGAGSAKNNADYQGFFATLLQRADRHDEAIEHYLSAVSQGASTPSTLVGLGISLQAVGKLENAKEAFSRAQTSSTLTPELSVFVEQRLKQINQKLRI